MLNAAARLFPLPSPPRHNGPTPKSTIPKPPKNLPKTPPGCHRVPLPAAPPRQADRGQPGEDRTGGLGSLGGGIACSGPNGRLLTRLQPPPLPPPTQPPIHPPTTPTTHNHPPTHPSTQPTNHPSTQPQPPTHPPNPCPARSAAGRWQRCTLAARQVGLCPGCVGPFFLGRLGSACLLQQGKSSQ